MELDIVKLSDSVQPGKGYFALYRLHVIWLKHVYPECFWAAYCKILSSKITEELENRWLYFMSFVHRLLLKGTENERRELKGGKFVSVL